MTEDFKNGSIIDKQSYLLEFRNVVVKKDDQMILDDVNGYAAPGEILALMGPVGAGKTTLLNLLSSRRSLTNAFEVEGKFLLNGKPLDDAHLLDIGYVMQDDILFAKMTLRETIRAYEVIEMVGLTKNLDTVIGGGIVRGLSGGERKRVSVAIELLINPSILFLDEPTSGLDSSIAYSLIKLVRNLTTKYQLTVVCSIHQPNSQIFVLFDNLLLLARGKPFYFGDVCRLSDYFSLARQPCPRGWNISDYAVEIIQSEPQVITALLEHYKIRCNPHVSNYSLYHIETHPIKSNSKFSPKTTDSWCVKDVPSPRNPEKEKSRKYMTSFSTQFFTLIRRSFFNAVSEYWTILNFVENVLLGLLIAMVWWFTPFDTTHFVSITGLIFFVCSSIVLQPLYSFIFGVPKESTVIIRETMSNNYSLAAYFITKQIAEIPILISRPFIVVTIFYWLVGFSGFLAYAYTCLILVSVSLIVAVCLGCIGLSQRETISLTLIYLILAIAFGGFFSRSAPDFMKWARFLSPIYHGYCLMFHLHFNYNKGVKCFSNKDKTFKDCSKGNSRVSMTSLLQFEDITVPFYANIIALGVYWMAFQVITYLFLIRSLNPKKKKISCKIKILKNKRHFKECF